MTKHDLMKLVLTAEELKSTDTAIPLHSQNHMREQLRLVGLEFDSSLYATDRNCQLINLAEKLLTTGKLQEIVDELERVKYQYNILKHKTKQDDPNHDDVINYIKES